MASGTLYIIMRNDLPSMNQGKAMAQASHASSMLVNMLENGDGWFDNNTSEAIQHWLNEGKGFGTTIVMETSHIYNIKECIKELENQNLVFASGMVKDETYPFLMQKELWRLLHPKVQSELGIRIEENAEMDKFGMIKATRPETTCGWVFIENGHDEQVKKIFETNEIKLAR